MAISRREMLTFGALSGGAMLIPLERSVLGGGPEPDGGERAAGTVHRSVLVAAQGSSGEVRGHHGLLLAGDARAGHRDHPGLPDQDLGLQRHVPRADLRRAAGPGNGCPTGEPTSAVAPDAGLHAVHLGAPPRVRLAAPVRRVRQRRHLPRLRQGLPLPELPGRAHALVPRPRRAPHRVERLHGAGRHVPDARRPRGVAPHPPGLLRRAADRQRRHVRQRRASCSSTTTTTRGSSAT